MHGQNYVHYLTKKAKYQLNFGINEIVEVKMKLNLINHQYVNE